MSLVNESSHLSQLLILVTLSFSHTYYYPLSLPTSHPSLPSPSSTPLLLRLLLSLLPLPPLPPLLHPVLDGEQKDLRSQLQSAEQELYELRQTHSLEVDSSRARQEEMERKVGDVHTLYTRIFNDS